MKQILILGIVCCSMLVHGQPKPDTVSFQELILKCPRSDVKYLYWLLNVGRGFLDKSDIPVNEYQNTIVFWQKNVLLIQSKLEAWRKEDSVQAAKPTLRK